MIWKCSKGDDYIEIKVQKKVPRKYKEEIKILRNEDIVNLSEVQEIKNATQEYLILVGLNKANYIQDVNLLGIGTNSNVNVSRKDLIRTALMNNYDRVVLVHNHPSNQLKPSKYDIELTNIAKKMYQVFGIELIDHIIITEEKYLSIYRELDILPEYKNKDIESIDNMLLQEENVKLKEENQRLKEQIQENDMDFEM